MAYGPGCTVQLAAGTYLTSQLVEYNFQGAFKGMGQKKTTIRALPNLPVPLDFFTQGECKPNTTDCLWPSLIIFVDGNITVSDLTISEPNVPATQPWLGGAYTCLNDGIRFMGQNRTNASVQRVTVKGAVDNSATSCPDFNFCNAVIFAGEYPRSQTPFDYYFLSGTFSVTNSMFSNVALGAGADGFLEDSRITIGGSPSAGNIFENVDLGPFLTTSQNSVEEVSYNNSSGNYEPLTIVPWIQGVFEPNAPSLFLVHDNTLTPAGPLANGIVLADDPTDQQLYALVYNNVIKANDIGYDVIAAFTTKSTTIVNNKISGTAPDGVGIYGGTYAAVLGNDVTGFVFNPAAGGLAQIVLDANTSHSTVVCRTPEDTVMNLGTNDTVIGCTELANNNARPSKMSLGPKVLKRKPSLP